MGKWLRVAITSSIRWPSSSVQKRAYATKAVTGTVRIFRPPEKQPTSTNGRKNCKPKGSHYVKGENPTGRSRALVVDVLNEEKNGSRSHSLPAHHPSPGGTDEEAAQGGASSNPIEPQQLHQESRGASRARKRKGAWKGAVGDSVGWGGGGGGTRGGKGGRLDSS